MKKLAVVAFGGNALLLSGQKGTIEEQKQNASEALKNLLKLIINDYNLVLTHGNGPQVGNILLSDAAGQKNNGLPAMPLDILVAYSQGFIGYLLEQQLRNIFTQYDIHTDIITLVTQVVVNKEDPAFHAPTKPIGPYYSAEEAKEFMKISSDTYVEDKNRGGWRKVVASPKPIAISNTQSIEQMARNGKIVITVGGGGIPVIYAEGKKVEGIDAVIDKDLASSLLARQIGADKLFILTDVPKVFLDYGTPQEKAIDKMTVMQAKEYLAGGQFGKGSMEPKVRAAVEFVENTGKDAIITKTTLLGVDNGGTRIVIS
jgi:carbamate kinase